MNTPKDAEFLVGQKALIRKDDKVLILWEHSGRLHFPGGKIQEGENDLMGALKREVREETSLEIKVGEPFDTWSITFPEGHKLYGKRLFLVAHKCEYISGEVRLSEEHKSYEWVSKNDLKRLDDGSQYFEVLRNYLEE